MDKQKHRKHVVLITLFGLNWLGHTVKLHVFHHSPAVILHRSPQMCPFDQRMSQKPVGLSWAGEAICVLI